MNDRRDMAAWDERYACDDYIYGEDPNEFLRERAGLLKPGGVVLCLAEGEGRNAVHLAKCGYEVTAVDQSPVGLAKANALAARHAVDIHTIVADLASWRIDTRHWDGIVSIWCHLTPALRREVYRQCVAALAPGGILLLEAYTPAQLRFGTGGPPHAELLPTLENLRDELYGLDFLQARERERPVHEGCGHRGRSAVVQVVARKPAAARPAQ